MDFTHYAFLALALVAIFALLTWAHLVYWTRRFALALPYAHTEELVTPDGTSIVLRRLPIPAGARAEGTPPVLLVHGLGANHRNQDLQADRSLARHLAAEGRDVWLLTLRSGRPPRSFADRRRIRFDAMATEDLPVAVRGVLDRTGASALDYVGFSMGGMLLYAALGRSVPEAWIRRAVIVGSPGRVWLSRPMRAVLRILPRSLVPTLRFRFLARAFAFASEWFVTPFHGVGANPKNLARGTTRAAMMNLVEDIPGALSGDFAAFALAGGELRVGGKPVLPGLAQVSVPVLFLAGTADRLAPIAAVRKAHDAWAAERPATPKRFSIVGRAHGHREDYGHGDLAIGKHVVEEIFPMIAAFLGPDAAGPAFSEEASRDPAGPAQPL